MVPWHLASLRLLKRTLGFKSSKIFTKQPFWIQAAPFPSSTRTSYFFLRCLRAVSFYPAGVEFTPIVYFQWHGHIKWSFWLIQSKQENLEQTAQKIKAGFIWLKKMENVKKTWDTWWVQRVHRKALLQPLLLNKTHTSWLLYSIIYV